MNDLQPVVRLHLWLESDTGMIFGPGRAEIIENIARWGSLQNAAKKMGISYRAAWGRIKKTEEVLGHKLIEKNSGGYQLTEFGLKLHDMYRQWFDNVERHALDEAKKIFPWGVVPYDNADAQNVRIKNSR
jgi:molybdate transport system regulatory protein